MNRQDYGSSTSQEGFSTGVSKIKEAIRKRSETDRIMSPLWILAPILAIVIWIVVLTFAFGGEFLFGDSPATGAFSIALIIGGFIAYILIIAYPWYLMIKRRTEHFKRDHILMSGIIEYLNQKQSESNINLTQELATLRSIASEANSEESEKSPLMYTILAIIIPYIGILYVLYFLMKDVYAHHQRISAFMQNTQTASNKLGESIVVPSWKTLPDRSFVLYFLLSCICSPFAFYWMYTIIKDYNDHFKHQWRFEDQLLDESSGTSKSTGPGTGGRVAEQQSFQQQPQQQEQQQPQQQQQPKQTQNPCPDCGGQMRYIEEYERWYCDDCQEYK